MTDDDVFPEIPPFRSPSPVDENLYSSWIPPTDVDAGKCDEENKHEKSLSVESIPSPVVHYPRHVQSAVINNDIHSSIKNTVTKKKQLPVDHYVWKSARNVFARLSDKPEKSQQMTRSSRGRRRKATSATAIYTDPDSREVCRPRSTTVPVAPVSPVSQYSSSDTDDTKTFVKPLEIRTPISSDSYTSFFRPYPLQHERLRKSIFLTPTTITGDEKQSSSAIFERSLLGCYERDSMMTRNNNDADTNSDHILFGKNDNVSHVSHPDTRMSFLFNDDDDDVER